MATGSIHHPYQATVTCAVCEGIDDVDSYCLVCKGPMCRTCVAAHTRAPIFKKHKIVTLVQGLQHQKAEEEQVECRDHPPYICSMHCNVCIIPICSKCVSSGVHKGHDIGEIEGAVRKVRQEVAEYLNILETKYLLEYRRRESAITLKKAEYKKVAMALKSDINKKRADVITEIHKVCDDMLNKVDGEEKQLSLEMDESFQNVQESTKEIELLITQSKEALTNLASDLMTFNQNKPDLSYLDEEEAPKIHPSTFIPATTNREKVAEQVGKLVSHKHLLIDTTIIHRAKFDKEISLVHAVDGNQAWVKVYNQNELRLVDSNGKVEKCINPKFDTYGFTVTTSGDVIVTDYTKSFIKIMTQTGEVTQTIGISSGHYKPTGVCLGNNKQYIIVCVTTSDETRSKLVVYSLDGKWLRIITYTDQPVGQFITQRVTQNNRGDYCVAHHGHNKVYVVDINGGLRWTYDGSGAGKLEKDFLPIDICSDMYNHLIISDIGNHKIHMLDDEGNFLRFLLTEQDGITEPYGLCFDKYGRLWVGQKDGGLCVVKYLK